jgi:hypothetical protein
MLGHMDDVSQGLDVRMLALDLEPKPTPQAGDELVA